MKKLFAALLAMALLLPVTGLGEEVRCPNHPNAGVHIVKDGPGPAYGSVKDSKRHYNVFHYYYVCDDCYAFLVKAYDATDGTTSPHSFWEGKCVECCYEEGSVVQLEDIQVEDGRKPKPSRTPQPISSGSGDWPTMNFRGTSTEFTHKNKRTQAYGGPDTVYPQTGAFMPNRQTYMTALYQENGYVLVDMYCEGHRRYVYFHDYDLTNTNVEYYEPTGYSVRTTRTYVPRFGPGEDYDAVVTKTNTGKTKEVPVNSGTQLQVLFEKDGWVLAQFYAQFNASHEQLIRAWFPTDIIEQ